MPHDDEVREECEGFDEEQKGDDIEQGAENKVEGDDDDKEERPSNQH